ncbi:hypothetical protein A2U01_0089771, partial [Trifolium medium]|nr:hypothetical protein [Trifolium medium]
MVVVNTGITGQCRSAAAPISGAPPPTTSLRRVAAVLHRAGYRSYAVGHCCRCSLTFVD